MAVRGSSVRMPSGHMMSRGQALLAGLSAGDQRGAGCMRPANTIQYGTCSTMT